MDEKHLARQLLHFILLRKLKSLEDIAYTLMRRMQWILFLQNQWVAALVPQIELDTLGVVTKRDVQSQIMTQALRKIHYSLSRSQTLIIFLNQVRFKPVTFEEKSSNDHTRMEEATCGGNALKFYAAVRLRMIRTGLLRTGDKATGLGVCVEVVKNKLAPAKKKAELEIQFSRGICHESEVLDLACERGHIIREGSSYLIEGMAFGDKQAAQKYLAENNGILNKIVTDLRMQLFASESDHGRSSAA